MARRTVTALVGAALVGGMLMAGCRSILPQEPETEEPAAAAAAAVPTFGPTRPSPRAESGPTQGQAKPPTGPAVPPMAPSMPPPMGPPPMALPPFPPGPGMPPPMMALPPFGPGGMAGPGLPGAPGLPNLGLPGLPAPTPDPNARPSIADLAYGTETRHKLDLYLPENAVGPAPIVVFVHGGAWASGDKSEYGWVGAHLARQGMLAAVVNYRLSPAVQHPTHAYDVAAATAWLYRNGNVYGGDPNKIYLSGHSAGAHLAALVALDPSYLAAAGVNDTVVQGVAGFAGAGYDLDAHYMATPLAPLFAPAFGQDPARWASAAPMNYVKSTAPPFLLVHGLLDNQVPAASVQAFAAALQREGVPTVLHLMPTLDHFSALPTGIAAVPGFVRDATTIPQELRKPTQRKTT